jgi:undecaprenyl diphosphate synthase
MNNPKHVAIIMDGNRRWAQKNKLTLLAGHRKAALDIIEPLVDTAIANNISHLTLWAFSTENWNREEVEVNGLMTLFREVLTDNIERFHKKGVRVRTIGDLSKFPVDIINGLEEGREKTKNNSTITLTFALNYGGRDEIIRAIKKLKEDKIDSLDQEKFSELLDTAGLPDPDLLIRTGGEQRLSGFLAWQSVYAELYFTDVLFPDFSPIEFEKAVAEFKNRQRRFGK